MQVIMYTYLPPRPLPLAPAPLHVNNFRCTIRFRVKTMPTTDENTAETVIETVLPSPSKPDLPGKRDGFEDPGPFLTEQSALKADTAAHSKEAKKKVGGRPRKDDLPQGSITRPMPIPVPRPPYTQYKSDATNAHQKSKAFYHWWNGLPEWVKNRTIVYVYRTWPILRVLKEEIDGDKELSYIDKISGNEPIQDDTDLLHKYGCGSYKLMFNEAPGPNICIIWVANTGTLLEYPPIDRRISNPETHLDMDNPGNKSYIEFLRMRGKLPEQQSKEKAEMEMATITTIDKMAETNERLMNKAIDMAKEGGRPSAPSHTPESTEVIIQATTKAMEIVQSAAIKANADRGDPIETALRLVEVMRPQAPVVAPMDTAAQEEVRELRRQVADMQTAQLQGMQEQIKTLSDRLAAPATAPAPATTQFSSIKEGITAFKEMKNLVDSVSGKGDGGDEEGGGGSKGPAWLSVAASVAPHVSSVFQSVQNMWALWQMGKGPSPFPGTPQQAQQPGQQPQPFQQPPASGAAPGPQLVPSPPAALPGVGTPPSYGLPDQAVKIFSQIQVPLLNYLEAYAQGDDNCDGKNFADWFLAGFGEVAFKSATTNGEALLTQALYAYTPIAEHIPSTGIDEVKFRQFVKDFVNFKVEDEVEGEEETTDTAESQESTTPVTGGAA